MPTSHPAAAGEALAAARAAESARSSRHASVEWLYGVAFDTETGTDRLSAALWLAANHAWQGNSAAARALVEIVLQPGVPVDLAAEAMFAHALTCVRGAPAESLEIMTMSLTWAPETSKPRLAYLLGAARLDAGVGHRSEALAAFATTLETGGDGLWAQWAADKVHGIASQAMFDRDFRGARTALDVLAGNGAALDDHLATRVAASRDRLDRVGPAVLSGAAYAHVHGDIEIRTRLLGIARECGDTTVEAAAVASTAAPELLAGAGRELVAPLEVAEQLSDLGLTAESLDLCRVIEHAGTATERTEATRRLAYHDYNGMRGEDAQERMLSLAGNPDPEIARPACLLAAHTAMRGGRLDEADALFARATAVDPASTAGRLGTAQVAIARGDCATALDVVCAVLGDAGPAAGDGAWRETSVLAKIVTAAAGRDPEIARRAYATAMALPANGFTREVERAAREAGLDAGEGLVS